jgi:hypothetical protein
MREFENLKMREFENELITQTFSFTYECNFISI